MTRKLLLILGLALTLPHPGPPASPARFSLTGDWDLQVAVDEPRPISTILRVNSPSPIAVTAEKHISLPLFNPKAGGWVKGAQLHGVQAQETTTPGLLDPVSFGLRAGPEPGAALFQRGKDYEIDPKWGTFGRLEGGTIKPDQAVFASYRHAQLRLDAVVLTSEGRIVLRPGVGRAAAPVPLKVEQGERHLGNIWLPGYLTKLGAEHRFPILESAYPEASKPSRSPAEQLLPRTMKKLATGERLRLLAWGDSVTVGTYVRPDWMGLTREREIDDDPRPYVKGLREFAAKQPVALADASRRYGRLWRQGLPYNTLRSVIGVSSC